MPEKNAPNQPESSESPGSQPASGGDDVGRREVQERVDEVNEKGYIGVVPDPLDNEAYTVKGVTTSDRAAKQDRGQGEPLRSTTDESFSASPKGS